MRCSAVKTKPILITLVIVCAIFAIVGLMLNINNPAFQSENELLEIINGVWTTGNTEYDFTISINNDTATISVGDKEDKPSKIILVPSKGYFYFEKNDDVKDKRYIVSKEDGNYIIKHNNWEFVKKD